MNIEIKTFQISSGLNTEPRYLARGYSEAGQLIIESVSHRDAYSAANEIAEWCFVNRPDWRVHLSDK